MFALCVVATQRETMVVTVTRTYVRNADVPIASSVQNAGRSEPNYGIEELARGKLINAVNRREVDTSV
jgi:hypothetical protein